MPEHSNYVSTADFLESSELNARLLRRLTSSPGVIDTQDILRVYTRLTKSTTRARLVLNDLLARYSVDDGSTRQNLPLVTEPPWMLNLNTSLTNSNSFLSTTYNSYSVANNAFVSPPSALSSASTLVPSASAIGNVSKHGTAHEVKTTQAKSESSIRTSGKFRVSRKPGRVTTEMPAALPAGVQNNRVFAPVQALTYATSRLPPGKEDDTDAKTLVANSAPLPLASRPAALSTVQGEASNEGLYTPPTVSSDRNLGEKSRPDSHEPSSPLNKQSEITKLTLNSGPGVRRLAERTPPAIRQGPKVSVQEQKEQYEFFARENADRRTAHTQAERLPTAGREAGALLPTGQRPPDFVWRRNRTARTADELKTAVSDYGALQSESRTAGRFSTARSSQSDQIAMPESARRTERRDDDVEVTAERILRSISNTLLVERERRGY